MYKWMNGRIDEWIDGWMDGWMDRWMDGWMDVTNLNVDFVPWNRLQN